MTNAGTAIPRTPHTVLSRIALSVWLVAMLWIGAGMLARHSVALPGPASSMVERHVSALRPADLRGTWLALHVLGAGCRCSERIVQRLLATPRPEGWSEMVAWIGAEPPPAELTSAFLVRRVDAEELALFGIEGTPALLAIDPTDSVRYAGGYSERKQSDDNSGRILSALRAGKTVASLPLFGCATSARLRSALAALPAP